MNDAALMSAVTASMALASLFLSANLACQRRNTCALIRSRRQNAATESPLADCRVISARHSATLRRIRWLRFIDRSSDEHQGHGPRHAARKKNAAGLPATA
jgi:hypothetical protein